MATAMSSSFVGTVHSREDAYPWIDRSDINLMASHDAVVRKLRAVYRDPVELAEAPGLPRRDLVTRDDVSSVSAVVFGTLVSVGALGAALPVIASGAALAAIFVQMPDACYVGRPNKAIPLPIVKHETSRRAGVITPSHVRAESEIEPANAIDTATSPTRAHVS